MPTFGQKLQELRENAGLTQQQFACASGVNVWTIRGYEQGRREPNWKMAITLAGALGVPVEIFAVCSSGEGANKKKAQPPKGNTTREKPRHARKATASR
jgi:transcriptional regulator with XRE-family HTH domain